MVIGSCIIELSIPAAHSLKDKRRVLKSIINRVQNEFNVSIAEVYPSDAWQSATLGVAYVSNGADHVHSILTKVINMIENSRFDAEIVDYRIEIL